MSYTLGINTTKNLMSILKAGNVDSQILINAVKEFIKVTPIDFCIIDSGGYRTAQMQEGLFLANNSKCDGWILKSKHQLGLAVDLVPWFDNKPTWEEKFTFYLAGAFMSFCNENDYPITSGADWNRDGNLIDGWDPCHMEINK